MRDGKVKLRATKFIMLPEGARGMFLRLNYGFLTKVHRALKARGLAISRATLTRTWYGDFQKPDLAVVAELQRHYREIIDSDELRRARFLHRDQSAA